jgi:hypothetical protein
MARAIVVQKSRDWRCDMLIGASGGASSDPVIC